VVVIIFLHVQPQLFLKAYKYCKDNNCSVVETDADDKWGIEDGEWCGISNKC